MASNSKARLRAPRRLKSDEFLVRDAKEVEKIFRKAVAEALRVHRALNNPVAVLQKGQVVLVKP